MSVIIEFENIGNVNGVRSYRLVNKGINIIEAPNRWGKSTFVKAISLCLASPLKSYETIQIARKMGIISRSSNQPNPLVNINSEHARISIKFNSKIKEIKLNKYGIATIKGSGDERFLLTSVLNRNSELLNRLNSGNTNLNWLVKILSISWKYESVLEILRKYISNFQSIINDIDYRRAQISKEIEELNKIHNKLKKVNQKIKELDECIQNVESSEKYSVLLQQREKLSKNIEEAGMRLKKLKNEYNNIRGHISEFINRRRKIEKQLEDTRNTYKIKEKELNLLRKRKKELESMTKKTNTKLLELNKLIEELREEIGKIKMHIELHEKALNNITLEEVKCPLCGEGKLKKSDLERKISQLKNQENRIKTELFKYTKERNILLSIPDELERIRFQISKLEDEIKDLRNREEFLLSSISGYKDESIRFNEERMNRLKNEIDNWIKIKEKYEYKLSSIETELSTISEKLGSILEQLNQLRKQKNELEAKSEFIKEKIQNLNILTLNDEKIDIEIAYKKVNLILNVLEPIEKYLIKEKLREENFAISIFNKQIEDILNKIGFKDLKVWIDAGSRDLHVIRNGIEFLPYRLLSESELYLIVTVLTIAMKIAYTKDIPFLLIDELILSFDEYLYSAIIDLLNNLIEEYRWCVIITRVGEQERVISLSS